MEYLWSFLRGLIEIFGSEERGLVRRGLKYESYAKKHIILMSSEIFVKMSRISVKRRPRTLCPMLLYPNFSMAFNVLMVKDGDGDVLLK